MTRKSTTIALLAAAALAAGGAGVAVGQQQLGGENDPVPVEDDAKVFVPKTDGNLGAAHQTSSVALRAHLAAGSREYLAGVDWGSARSFPVPGTKLRGWTFDQPGRRCLALPDPLAEGYGVTCKTPKEIAAGEATVLVLPPTGSQAANIVGVITAEGQDASLRAPDGAATTWERIGDVQVGTAPTGSRLVTAAGSKAIESPSAEIVEAAPPPSR